MPIQFKAHFLNLCYQNYDSIYCEPGQNFLTFLIQLNTRLRPYNLKIFGLSTILFTSVRLTFLQDSSVANLSRGVKVDFISQ